MPERPQRRHQTRPQAFTIQIVPLPDGTFAASSRELSGGFVKGETIAAVLTDMGIVLEGKAAAQATRISERRAARASRKSGADATVTVDETPQVVVHSKNPKNPKAGPPDPVN